MFSSGFRVRFSTVLGTITCERLALRSKVLAPFRGIDGGVQRALSLVWLLVALPVVAAQPPAPSPMPAPTPAPAPAPTPAPVDEPGNEPSPAEPDDPARGGDEPGGYPVEPVALPDTAAGRELRWVIDVINGRATLGEPAAKFTKPFLEIYPPAEITDVLTTLREKAFGGASVDMVVLEEFVSADTLSGVLRGKSTRRVLSVFISIDDASGLIAGLLFTNASYGGGGDEDGGWESMESDLGKLQGGASFAAFEIVRARQESRDGAEAAAPPRTELRVVHEFGWDKRLNVAAASRAMLALGVAREVEAGRRTWDQPITITNSMKSVPGSDTFGAEAGTTITLDEALYRTMVALDASAWDHLIATTGREPLDAALASAVVDPQRSLPMLTTRELFTLKLAASDEAVLAYTEANAAARIEMLAPGGAIGAAAATMDWGLLDAWTEPTRVEQVGVFATARELCEAMRLLHEIERPAGVAGVAEPKAIAAPEAPADGAGPMTPLSEALRDNGAGLDLDPNVWKSAAWTSGFEPGVGAHAWLLERADGRWFTIAVVWNNASDQINEEQLLDLGKKGVALVANVKEPVKEQVKEPVKERVNEEADETNPTPAAE